METTDGPDSVVFYFLEGGRPRGLQAPASFDTNDLKALVSVQPPTPCLAHHGPEGRRPITKQTAPGPSSRAAAPLSG